MLAFILIAAALIFITIWLLGKSIVGVIVMFTDKAKPKPVDRPGRVLMLFAAMIGLIVLGLFRH
jgi:hypothetical protein